MKTNQELFQRIRELKEEILSIESSLKNNTSFMLITEEHVKKYYDGFKQEYGLDAIFHNNNQGLSIELKGQDYSHLLINNTYYFQKETVGNNVYLANKRQTERDTESDTNRGRWIGWWDFEKKFENVTHEQFAELCKKYGIGKLEVAPEKTPYYDSVDDFLKSST